MNRNRRKTDPMYAWSTWLAELDLLMIRELDMSVQNWICTSPYWGNDVRECFERGETAEAVFARIAMKCRSTAV